MSQRKFSQWIFVALLALWLVSCRENGNEFHAPEITKAEAVVEGSTATLRCTLSNDRIERCGFRLSDGEKDSELEAVLSGNSFEATVQGLQVDITYSFVAFASAGESEICSQPQTFLASDGAIPIPDPAFKAYLLKEYDTDGDGEISLSEARSILSISFCTNELNVKSLSGIEYMANLEEINCTGDFLPDYDLGDREYYYLSKKYRQHLGDKYGPIGTLESLDVSHNPELRILRVWNNAALGDYQHALNLSKNMKLEVIDLSLTALQMPDISHLPGITDLYLSHLWGPFPDLKPLTQLRKLDISFEQTYRQLDVDVSHCPNLEELNVSNSARTISDFSYNPELRVLYIKCCDISNIDLSALSKLRFFDGSEGGFRSVDVSANPELSYLDLSPMENDLLETLYIAPGQRIPGVTENRSEEFIPSYTKIVEKSPDSAIPIPDPAFKAYLLKEYDSNGDGEISQIEANVIWRISFCTNELNVKSLSGIEFMPYLEEINCPGEFLYGLDLGGREHYHLSKKYDRSVNLGPIGTLESLDVSNNPELRVLRLYNNAALGEYQHELDLSKNMKLEAIDLGFTALQMPDISHLPGLLEMRFSNIWGPFPDLKPFTQLRALDLCYEQTGRRMDVDVSHCPYLEELYVGGIARTLSDLSFNPELRTLMDIGNGFTERDLSILPKLTSYHGHNNRYRTLDVSANPELIYLSVSPMDDDMLETLYIAPGQKIPGVTENRSEEFIPSYTKIVEKSQDSAIPIPDPAFKAYLLKIYDSNRDGEISQIEANMIWSISFCTNELNVKSISGIEYMPNLEEISCYGDFLADYNLGDREHYYLSKKYHLGNGYGPIGTLESLDVSHNPKLRVLKVWNNAALGDYQRVLDLSRNMKLEAIDLGFTGLQMPDISHLPGITELFLTHLWGPFPDLKPLSQLRKLDISFEQTYRQLDVDVSHCPYLEELNVNFTARTLSDLSYNPELRKLSIMCCDFSSIDISALTKLRQFDGSKGHLRSVDVSANPELSYLDLSPMENDLLETLYIAPGQKIPGVTENRSEEFIPSYTKIIEKSIE